MPVFLRRRSRLAAHLSGIGESGLARQSLEVDGVHYRLAAGMQVSAEVHLGIRTVLEYLLSPVQTAWREVARER